jgi:16S rRNA (uracil1498-N3)-methyltransferase
MKLQRFFIEEHLRNKKEVTLFEESIIHQLKDVFRLHSGNRIILLDNSGFEYLAEIIMLARGKAEIKILEANARNSIDKEVWLFASLIKKDNFEWIVEKCTELGVSHFVPVLSERSEKKDLNIERAEKIIKEASEQSGRAVMPILHEIVNLEEALELNSKPEKLIAFHPEGELFTRDTVLGRQTELGKSLGVPDEKISYGIFIGPEGGWTEKEIELFKTKSIPLYSLGKQILRAETAAVAISSLFLL